ncbi:hypothetical protein ACWDLG_32310 [Nonomuraea sp. NPDC003727]
MDVESSICLSDLVPALRWSRPQQVAEALADPRLPAGWWGSLSLSRALGTTGVEWMCERLARLAASRWDHLPLADVLPALHVHHVDPSLPGWPEPARTVITDLGGWRVLRRLSTGDLGSPPSSASTEVVVESVFREVLGRIPATSDATAVRPAGALPQRPGAEPAQGLSQPPEGGFFARHQAAPQDRGASAPLPQRPGGQSQGHGPAQAQGQGQGLQHGAGAQDPAAAAQRPGGSGPTAGGVSTGSFPAVPGQTSTGSFAAQPGTGHPSTGSFPAQPGTGHPSTGSFPAQPVAGPPSSGSFPAQPGTGHPSTGSFPAQPVAGPPSSGSFPAQPGTGHPSTGSFPAQPVAGAPGTAGAPGAPGQPGAAAPNAPGQPGAAPGQPGAVPGQPGAAAPAGGAPGFAGQPGAVQGQPGAAAAQGAAGQPGAAPGQPGAAAAPANGAPGFAGQPGAVAGQPGGVADRPGGVPGQPGAVAGQPGAPGQGAGTPSAGQPGGAQPAAPNQTSPFAAQPQGSAYPKPPLAAPAAGSPDDDYPMVRVVDGLFRSFDRLELAVAVNRLFAAEPDTLRSLAHKLLVDREVLSQAQRTAEERVLHWLRSSESAPVTGHMFRLTEWLGTAATEDQLIGADPAHPVIVPTLRSPLWRVLVTLMPDRRLQDGWLVVGDLAGLQARTRRLLAAHPADADVEELLGELGIRRHSAKAWLDALPAEALVETAAAAPAVQQPLPRRTPGANGHHHRGGQPVPPAPQGPIDPSAALATLSALSGGRSPLLAGAGTPPPLLAGTPSSPPPPLPSPASDPRRWQRIDVTPEHLRGGPVAVPEGYAAQLGMRPGTLLSVTGPGDNAIVLVWRDQQPVFDSLQPVLMRLNARPGDQVYVTVDGYRLEAQLTS